MTEGIVRQVSERLFGSPWRAALLTLALAALIYLPLLGNRPLLGADEPRVAAIAAEMERYGDWVEPTLNGEPFLEIPPLHWWISAGTCKLLGEGTASAKLPSALAALAGALCAFGLARAFGLSSFASFLCALALATAPEYWIVGRRCIMDMTLCAFVALAFLAFANFAREGQEPWRKSLWLAAFWAGLSGALLSKGIIGLGIPCSGLFVWLLVKRERSLAVWGGLFGAAALSLLPVSAWLVALWQADGAHAVKTVVWTNNLGRFTGSHAEHVEPFYYYFAKFPGQFLPWTLGIAATAWLLFSKRLKEGSREAAIFSGICLAVPFAALCVAAGKRAIYLLPLYPVAALFAASAADWALERLKERWRDAAKLGAVALLAVAAVSLLCSDAFLHHKTTSRKSYEPAFAKCAELIGSGRRMIIHSGQERIIGASVFYLGRRFQVLMKPEEVKDVLTADSNAFAISDNDIFEKLGGGVRVLEKFPTGSNSFIAVFDAEPSKAAQ